MTDEITEIQPYRLRDLMPDEDGVCGQIEYITPGNIKILYTIELLGKLVKVKANDPKPQLADLMAFGNCCIETGANPYLKEAWLVYMNGSYVPIISAQFKLRKAHECKGYAGFTQGWITTDGKRHPSGIETTALPKDIIGVWGKFYRDNEAEYYHETFMFEFERSTWKKKLTMLLKVNRDHGIRHKYPELLDGLYTENEMPGDYVHPKPHCETPERGQVKQKVTDTNPIVDPAVLLLMLGVCKTGFEKKVILEHHINLTEETAFDLFIQFTTYILQCKKEDIETTEDYTFEMLTKLNKALEQPLPKAIVELLPKDKDK